jgi:hypothetical protein
MMMMMTMMMSAYIYYYVIYNMYPLYVDRAGNVAAKIRLKKL